MGKCWKIYHDLGDPKLGRGWKFRGKNGFNLEYIEFEMPVLYPTHTTHVGIIQGRDKELDINSGICIILIVKALSG